MSNIRQTARYSRYDQMAWTDAQGMRHEGRVTPENVRAALLSCGTKRHFTIYAARTAVSMVASWRVGIGCLNQLRRGWYAHG